MLELLDDMQAARVDALGFHTGCLVAAEMAVREPGRFSTLVLVDIPHFDAAERDERHARSAMPRALTADLSCLAADRSHWGFHAAFTYRSDERFPLVAVPARVIATQSGLLDATRRAVRALHDVRFTERLDIKRAVFEEGASEIAKEIEATLE